jgi:histidinol dehydrogenase
VQRLTRAGLRAVAESAVTMARVEGLAAHADSIEARRA